MRCYVSASLKVSVILKRARGLLTPDRWGQGEMVRLFHKHCAATAINAQAGPIVCRRNAVDAYMLVARCATGLEHGCLPTWNDQPERTLQDVLDAFDAAIAIAEADEQNTATWAAAVRVSVEV